MVARMLWYAPAASGIRSESLWGSLMEWWLNISATLGWLLSSIFVLSFTRLARSSQ
jgi:hypothetical protein